MNAILAERPIPGPTVAPFRVPHVSVGMFAATDHIREAMIASAGDRRMTRANIHIENGGFTAAIGNMAEGRELDLIVVEATSSRPDTLLADLGLLARECTRGTKVIVIGETNDVSLYRDLLSAGVSDYLVPPLEGVDLVSGIMRIYAGSDDTPTARVIAFIGARGGSGSSTVCHNVAAATAAMPGTRVFLADLDLDFGTVGLDFNIDSPQGTREVLDATDTLDTAMIERMSFRKGPYFHILPALSSPSPAKTDPGDIEQFVEVASMTGGTVMLDLPTRWDAATEASMRIADEIVIVSTPDLTGMRNTKNLLDTVRKLRPNDVLPRLVLNQVGMPRRPEVSPSEFSSAVKHAPDCIVGFDAAAFGRASNHGVPLVELKPRHPATLGLTAFSRMMAGQSAGKKRNRKHVFFKLLGLKK